MSHGEWKHPSLLSCGDIHYRLLVPIEMAAFSKPLPSIPSARMPREYLAEEMILWGRCGVYRTMFGYYASVRTTFR
jgi:hypothetical protein